MSAGVKELHKVIVDKPDRKPRMTEKRLRQLLDDAEQQGYMNGFNVGRRENKRPFVEFFAGLFVGIVAAGIAWFLK